MERLTKRIDEDTEPYISCEVCKKKPMSECWSQENCTQTAVDRLSSIEDILGDDYDLDRLRELVEADREGQCVVLPFPLHSVLLDMWRTFMWARPVLMPTAGTIQSADGGKTFFLDLDNGILRMNSYPTKDEVQTSVEILTNAINTKITSAEAQSMISQSAKSIRLQAMEISWSSAYSSMSSDGRLTCKNAAISGEVTCGTKDGYWLKMNNDGTLTGGLFDNTYGTLNCAYSFGEGGAMGIKAANVVLDGTVWVYTENNGYQTWQRGQTETVSVISYLDIHGLDDGGVAWSYTYSDIEFVNGVMTSVY